VSETAIHSERRGRVEVIVIDHPPVNALAQPLRAALLAAVEAAESDPAVLALVIHGAGRYFVAGADIREFDHEPRAPLLNDVLLRIEAAAKPVIAALHGSVLGGGFELALACHYRVAAPDVSFGRRRCLLALINEGARLLGDGIAAVPGDIGAIWCNGYGFPRFRGGPMFYADTLGLGVVLDGVHRFAETLGRKYWAPAPLLEELGRSGDSFQAWRAAARREESGS
jgi:3-hydroxyacyl-CoA dehydrogenase